mmetsp:Transcript_15647/g.27022  ORF Transcript_15647/g.27022 Transcript_15647/m.27022 type:complete len:283 (-) Transcript_15647:791-1639(-)|eukprot:CAMPEP_0196668316 /NCGR_PEP_ID=MMETSP1086-20130531/65556_1 /TAXON_ID=77921 /ORGANISM="Cyanoptyche  gloeocystis , Strain SAG4.97" /LENGTH=282 /DNA_ID=CAMNT_0042005715 /DNA_START=43 /DNA_END=891 /DNA_ORIENTATION=+
MRQSGPSPSGSSPSANEELRSSYNRANTNGSWAQSPPSQLSRGGGSRAWDSAQPPTPSFHSGDSFSSGRADDVKRVLSDCRLFVEVVAARNLLTRGSYFAPPENNGYVLLAFGDHGYKTKTKLDDVEPVWNHEFLFKVSRDLPEMPELHVELRHQRADIPDPDDPLLGTINISLRGMRPNEKYSSWYSLQIPPPRSRTSVGKEGDILLNLFMLDYPKLYDATQREERERFAVTSAKMQEANQLLEQRVAQLKDELGRVKAESENQKATVVQAGKKIECCAVS